MPYIITASSVYPRGGFVNTANDEWSKIALQGGYGADYSHAFKGGVAPPLDLDKVPQYLVLQQSRPQLPDMFWGENGLLVVSGAYHDLIEALDPGVHQLWPMEIRRKRKGAFEGRWYGLNVRVHAEAQIEAESVVHVQPPSELTGLGRRVQLDDMKWKSCLDQSRIPDAHLWWDVTFIFPILMCSDAFHAAVAEAELKSIPMKKVRVK